jgi:hypothetical protein
MNHRVSPLCSDGYRKSTRKSVWKALLNTYRGRLSLTTAASCYLPVERVIEDTPTKWTSPDGEEIIIPVKYEDPNPNGFEVDCLYRG